MRYVYFNLILFERKFMFFFCLYFFGFFEIFKELVLNNLFLILFLSDKICFLGLMKFGKIIFVFKLVKDFKNFVYINYNDMCLN